MASRLSRWSAVTLIVIGVAMVLLLPPGISPLVRRYEYRPTEPTNALDAAVQANRRALDAASFTLREVVFARTVKPFLGLGRSPIVLRDPARVLGIDPVLTAVADSLWQAGPRDPAAPRTLIIASGQRTAELRARMPKGICYAVIGERGRNEAPITVLRGGVGGCLLATRFGPPGRGLGVWLASGRAFRIPGNIPRLDGPVAILHPINTPWVSGREFDPDGAWWTMDPWVSACLGGRSAFCTEALDLGPERAVAGRWAFYRQSVGLSAALPAALLEDLGPDRFTEVWRSDAPLPAAYARATGRPFDEWAVNFAQHLYGRLVVETALSWLGWAGWAFWMALLFGWLVVRMREQAAQ